MLKDNIKDVEALESSDSAIKTPRNTKSSSFSVLFDKAKGAYELAINLTGTADWVIALLIIACLIGFILYIFKEVISTAVLS